MSGTRRHLGGHANGDIGAGKTPVDHVLDALGKREHRAGNSRAIGEPAQVVLHDNVHAAAGVLALGHAAAAQAVSDEHRMLPALGLQQRLDGGRVHMLAVADDLGIRVGRGHGSTHNAGLAMMKATLAVVGVRKAAGAGVNGRSALVIGSVGVANAGHDPLSAQRRGIGGSAVALSGHGALNDAPTGSLLPLVKDFLGRVDQIGGVLRTHVLHGKERALQVDALNAGTTELGTALLIGLCNSGAGLLDLLHTVSKGRGQPAGGTATGELGRADVDALGIVIGRGVVIEAVDVGVHHTRRNPRPRVILNLASGLVGLPGAKDAVLDHKVATQLRPCRQKELVGLDSIRAHLSSRTRSAF